MISKPINISNQCGFAIILFFLVIFLGAIAVVLPNINHEKIRKKNDQVNRNNLLAAKEALLNYAANSFRLDPGTANSRYGYLPCPDADGAINPEGAEDPGCGGADDNSIGRLPWRNLGLQYFRDINNECLWYAVAGPYKNNPPNNFINSDTPGTLQVSNENGNVLATDVVAVIIAPGRPLGVQDRTQVAGTNVCGGNYVETNYLDTIAASGLSNADITAVPAGNSGIVDDFYINSTLNTPTENIALGNDELVYITRQELWAHLAKNQQLTLEIANRILFGTAEQAPALAAPLPLPANQNGLWACIRNIIERQGNTANGVVNRRFPLPTLLDLDDYTINSNYVPDTSTYPIGPPPADQVQPLLNRLPDFNLINPNCQLVGATAPFPVWTDQESINLYDNWKDHFFVALSSAADPRTADYRCPNPPPAGGCIGAIDGINPDDYDVRDCDNGNCLTVNTAFGVDGGLPVYATIIFSGFSQNLAIRNGDTTQWPFIPPAPAPGSESKNSLGLYLEGVNNKGAAATIGGAYTLQQTVPVAAPLTPPLISSDILYCITMTTDTHILNIQLCP